MSASQSAESGNVWRVSHIYFRGVVTTASGEFTNLLQFKAELRSTKSSCVVDVRVDGRALHRLVKRIETGTSIQEQSNHRALRTITKVIEELLAIDLSFDGANHWDPVQFPQWQLEERAITPFLEGSLKDNGSEHHSAPRFLAFVGNLLRSA